MLISRLEFCIISVTTIFNLLGGTKMTYNMVVENDNGNSSQKVFVDGEYFLQPNVYGIIHTSLPETDASLEEAIATLHKNIHVRIDTKVLGEPQRYLIGYSALQGISGVILENMDVLNPQKHKEKLPLINTLGLVAVKSVQKHFKVTGKVEDKENIEVEVDMFTALPVSTYTTKNAELFKQLFMSDTHEVKVFVKNISINVKVKFRFVDVLREGVPPMFALITDGEDGYRDDDMFDEFRSMYKLEEMDGSYLEDKRVFHMDIGDGTLESLLTETFSVVQNSAKGFKFGMGQALEAARVKMEEEFEQEFTRQEISQFIQGKGNKRYVNAAKVNFHNAKVQLADKIVATLDARLTELKHDTEILAVYGGAAIELKDVLFEKLKEYCKPYFIELLYVPAPYAVEMNVRGMRVYSELKLEELLAEQIREVEAK